MRVLLFGGGGQVGTELVRKCAELNVKITAYHRAQCDIRNEAEVSAALDGVDPTVVINAAAYTAVDRAESEPELAFSTNRDAPMNIARICGQRGVPLIHLSTDYVFDGTKPNPYLEQDDISPVNVYGMSKHAGEVAIRSLTEEHIIIRTAWVYGCYGRNFLKTMLALAKSRDEWAVVADQQGNPTSTVDLTSALMASARAASDRRACWGTYHFTGAGDATWFDFAQEIISAQRFHTGLNPTLSPVSTREYPTAARRPANSRLQSSLFAETFGVRAAPWPSRVHEAVRSLLQV